MSDEFTMAPVAAALLVDEDGLPVRCLDDHDEQTCRGPVEYHSIDPGRSAAHPRCRYHWQQRLERRENSIERYADSDVPPPWFDPMDAGERWDDDY